MENMSLFVQLGAYLVMVVAIITKLQSSAKQHTANIKELKEQQTKNMSELKCDIKSSKEERQRELGKLESYIDKKFDKYNGLREKVAIVESAAFSAHKRIDELRDVRELVLELKSAIENGRGER